MVDGLPESNNGDTHQDAAQSQPLLTLPSATPLSHSSPALRPGNRFDPSDLLCSLLPASLPKQAQQLVDYDQKLSQELETVVDEEYKDFIALAARLGGERQRIDRLANWAGGSGQQGLEGVRLCVEEERDEVMAAQIAVQQLLHHRQMIETRKADLKLLLSFSDIMHRLERLLMIPSKSGTNHTTEHPEPVDLADHSASSGVPVGLFYQDDDNDILEALQKEIASTPNGDRLIQPLGPQPRYPSTSTPAQQERISTRSLQHFHPGRKLDLPTRIARAKTTWENLDFLRRAAVRHRHEPTGPKVTLPTEDVQDASSTEAGSSSPFLNAHEERLKTIEATLKGDLRSLFSRLMTPGALLVESDGQAGLLPNVNSLRDLDRWSQVPLRPTKAETSSLKLQERSAWLNMVLDAWTKIGSAREGSIVEIQEHLREKLIAPWCRDHVHLAAQQVDTPDYNADVDGRPRPRLLEVEPSRGPQPLVNMYNLIIRFVHSIRTLTALLDAFEPSEGAREEQSSGGLTSLHTTQTERRENKHKLCPFQDVLWTEIARAISEQVGEQLFYVGTSEDFHQNYVTTQRFLDVFSTYCPSTKARQAWLQHPTFLAFNRRWQLSVYFQMRYRIIATSFERELGSIPLSVAIPVDKSPLPLLKATQCAINAFLAPWAPDAHLTPLISRQWRLSLMVVARYHNYLSDQQGLLTKGDGQRGDTTAPSSRQLPPSIPASPIPPRSSTPDPDSQARDERSLKTLAILAADTLWFKAEVIAQLHTYIKPLIIDSGLKGDDDSLMVELQAGLDGALPIESSLLTPIGRTITTILKTRCAEALRLVRSINTQYRSGTSTPASASASILPSSTNPSVDGLNAAHGQGQGRVEPSYFVPVILKPLRIFLGKGERNGETFLTPGRLVGEMHKNRWASEVVEDVAVRYAASLTQMIQNYESLRRLKRGGLASGVGGGGFGGLASSFFRGSGASTANSPAANTGATNGNATDAEWIRMQGQMKVDVARLEQDVRELTEVDVRVDLENSEAWSLLREIVGSGAVAGHTQTQMQTGGKG